jgi:hypothetical protein
VKVAVVVANDFLFMVKQYSSRVNKYLREKKYS